MKNLSATLLFFLAAALPVGATTQITVAQLEQTVAAARSTPDEKFADTLSALELTERLSPSTLARIQSSLPGPKSQQELSILAARSSFLDVPAAEIPSAPAPNVAQQRQIMGLVVSYVTRTILKLPDFLATRETRSFEDRPAGVFNYLPLHQTNRFAVSVLYRDGKEVDRTSAGKKAQTPAGLVSWGEFGPILSTVLLDAARSQLVWSHWEQGSSGRNAVFRYSVPGKKSQFQLQMCGLVGLNPDCDRTLTGYHGEIAADPASGAILRLTAVADIEPGSNLEHDAGLTSGSIMVEYGPVDIGGKAYICPVRSVAIAQIRETQPEHGVIAAEAMDRSPKKTLLNSVSFTDYHVFRGESRMLTDAEAAQIPARPSDAPTPDTHSPPVESEPTPTVEPQPAAASSAPSSDTVATSSAASESKPAPSAPTNPSAAPETAPAPPSPAAGSTAESVSAPSTSAVDIPDTPVFRTTARQVLVDVIVGKRNGDPVAGIPQSDFSVAEDGNPQTIDFFEEHSATAPATATTPAMPPIPPGVLTNVPTAPPSAALYVFLLDSLNSEPQDQAFIHQQILAFLHRLDPGTEVAIFTLGSSLHLLQGFTSDPALLLAAVSDKTAERDAMAQNRSDNADDAAHIGKLQSMRASAAKIGALQAAETSAHAYSFSARASMTFEALNALARYLEGIAGRKNLIWFSSSFPVVFFPTQSELAQLKNNPNLPGYADRGRQTANLFTLSKIAVYPLSGAGVMNSNIGMADSADAGSAGGSGHFGTSASPTSSLSSEALNSGSALSGMEQLAASTGGRAYTTNDIDAALRRIVHDSNVFYSLGYAPAHAAADGGFRRIDVKVAGGKYKLNYRQGYNASEPTAPGDQNPIAPLLQLGIPNATGILYGAETASASPATHSKTAGQNSALKGPLTRYSVSFTLRTQDISFDEAPNGIHIARLLLGVKAYGEDGSALNWQATREAVELNAMQYQSALKSGIPVTLDIDVPANTHARLVTAVYDWNTTRSGTLEIPLHP